MEQNNINLVSINQMFSNHERNKSKYCLEHNEREWKREIEASSSELLSYVGTLNHSLQINQKLQQK